MKSRLNEDGILARYPEKKPVCLNYATVREDVFMLIKENEELKIRLDAQVQPSELQ